MLFDKFLKWVIFIDGLTILTYTLLPLDSNLIAIGLCPEFHLGEHLVSKEVAHYKARVASSTTKVHQSALRQQQDMLPIRELITIHLMGKRRHSICKYNKRIILL